MNNMKFEIILSYYKRPEMVKNALDSVLNSNNQNYNLTFIDDSGNDDFKDTFLNYGFDKNKIKYIPIMMSDEEKEKIGGSIFGKYINETIATSDADVYISLCDDDAILPTYLDDLDMFFTNNPDEVWCYSHLKFFNPEKESYLNSKSKPDNPTLNYPYMNRPTQPINPFCKVDSTQVVFKIKALKDGNIEYPHPQTANLDAAIYNSMFKKYGNCPFTGVRGQCKGWFDDQLGVRIRQRKNKYK